MAITDPVILVHIDGNLWKTAQEFSYKDVTVPEGFITDLASVPWPTLMLIPKSGQYNPAALIHDFLYYIQDRSRKEADAIFLQAMKDLKINAFKRRVMYYAVRLFGWIPWKVRPSGNFNVATK